MRPTQDEYFIQMAKLVATRSNCYKRQVGCVAVDKNNNILSTGYNGVPRGFPHCKEGECPRDNPGEDLHLCLATHAEMNAILQCPDVMKIAKIYVTDSPCLTCTVVLLNTGCQEIIFAQPYPGNGMAEKAWVSSNRIWRKF